MPDPFQLFRPLDAATEGALRESIVRFGVLVPVARDQHGRTLDGYHRSRIADELGVSYRVDVVTVTDDEEAREIARTLNADRRHLTREQQREVARFLREQGHSLRAIAKATDMDAATVMRDTSGVSSETPDRVVGLDGKRYPSRRPTVVAARNEREAVRVQTALAMLANPPGGVMDVRLVERAARQTGREVRERRPTPEFPPGRFPVLLADPPWRYDHNETPALRAIEANHYDTMTVEEITQLADRPGFPAADDSVLFLWATNPKLPEALAVMAAWGFTYRTNAVWVKDRIGMGYYVRGQHELLLIGRRGDMPAPGESDRPASVIHAPRREHSAKPVAAYELIERMYPRLPRVELFARGDARPGWTTWGREAA